MARKIIMTGDEAQYIERRGANCVADEREILMEGDKAVYQEIARQNYGKSFNTHLIAATKEDEPDMDAIQFDNLLLEIELKEFSNNIVYYDKIKKGLEPVKACNTCDYCKAHKIITDFREVK